MLFRSGNVSEETASRVTAYIREFIFPHTRAFYRDLESSTPEAMPVRQIAGLILAEGLTTLTTTRLWRNWSGWRKLDNRSRREVLNGLCESGWLSKRSETAYNVHPEVHGLMPERAAIERKRRTEYARLFDVKLGRQAGED